MRSLERELAAGGPIATEHDEQPAAQPQVVYGNPPGDQSVTVFEIPDDDDSTGIRPWD